MSVSAASAAELGLGSRYAPRRAPEGLLDGRPWAYRSRRFRAVDHDFCVRLGDASLGRHVDEVFRSFESTGTAAHVYSLVDRGPSHKGRFALYYDDQRLTLASGTGRALSLLLWHVNREVVAKASARTVVLHAAAAERDGVGVVLPAPMESGKTTTVAGLVRAGFRYLTDEAVVLPASLLIEPFAKALSVDRGSWEVLADLRPATASLVPGQWQVSPMSIRPDAVATPTRPRLVVAPRYRTDADTRLEAVSRATMLSLLAQSTFHFADHGGRNLRLLAEMVRGCGCYTLDIGHLGTAVDLIDELVNGVLSHDDH